jgi:hypothetical protein
VAGTGLAFTMIQYTSKACYEYFYLKNCVVASAALVVAIVSVSAAVGLPMLRARRDDGAPEEVARLDPLLSIMVNPW